MTQDIKEDTKAVSLSTRVLYGMATLVGLNFFLLVLGLNVSDGWGLMLLPILFPFTVLIALLVPFMVGSKIMERLKLKIKDLLEIELDPLNNKNP